VTVVSVPAALASVVAVSTQVKKGVDPPPPVIDTADLPLAYVLTRDATHDWQTEGEHRMRLEREYVVRVPVLGTGSGTPDQRETMCRPVLNDVVQTIAKYPQLGLTQGVNRAWVVRDSGIVVLPDFQQKWIGFEVHVRVLESEVRTYASGE
jgi:hypothetical protein